LKSSARECVDRRLKEIAFVLIRREGAVRNRAMQGVCKLREIVSVMYLSRSFGGLLLQVCAESRELQHLDMIENFPQGVHTRVLSKD
jgi:hypothetical protein